jgi:hypothetical protein
LGKIAEMSISLIKDLNLYLERIRSLQGCDSGIRKIFTVGNTRIAQISKYYFTPIREFDGIIVGGVIVFSELEAGEVLKQIDGLFDFILIDTEKKSISVENSNGVFNLERLSYELIKKSKIVKFKGNDLTTNSIEDLISGLLDHRGSLLGGRNVLIIGLGNLGFKIALRLVEVGMNVYVKSRSSENLPQIINVINLIKPRETVASVSPFDSGQLIKSPYLDIVVLCATSLIHDFYNYLDYLKSDVIILDVGKGCLSDSQVAQLKEDGRLVYRLDIGESLNYFIKGKVINKVQFNIPACRKIREGLVLISKGIVGIAGEIVVDDIEKPKIFYGMCDGKGGLLRLTSEIEQEIIDSLNL